MSEKQTIAQLQETAKGVRKNILKMIHQANSGHPGGALSATEVLTALYFSEMQVDPKNPKWADRDRFVLSKGHACPVQYACLAMKGFFPEEELMNLRKEGSILQGHPDMKKCPGIDISTGSLGQGISAAVGMAVAAKMDKKDYMTYAMVGDGECNEGQIWEAVQCATKYKLDNFMLFVDNNRIQCDDFCDNTMPTLDFKEKMTSFGFETCDIDGHDMEAVVTAIQTYKASKNGKPKCIVCKCVKGKGVSFMEDVPAWHGMAPNDDQYAQGVQEIEEANYVG